MESEKTKCETSRDSVTDGQVPDNDDDKSQSPISKLSDKYLIRIFSLLPIADRFRIQRVCKHWQAVSLKSWLSLKTLGFKEEEWGFKYWLGKGIDLNVFERVLKLCGPHVTRIDFSQHYRDSEFVKLSKANKDLFVLIKDFCPNLTSIDIRGLEVTAEGLEYLGKSYSNLAEFLIDGYEDQGDDEESVKFDKPLSLLFENNKNLRRVILNVATDGNCLLDLNHIAIEEISVMHGAGGEENICRALKKCVNLSSFGITDWSGNFDWYEDEGLTYMNEMLEAIEPHSENLKELDISTTNYFPVIINSKNLNSFSNLQKLSLEGEELRIDLNTIAKYCTKLTCVHLMDLSVTDSQVASIMQLPELQELRLWYLDKITDAIFINHVSSLKRLECTNCPRITNVGFSSLLQNSSKSLETLMIDGCKEDDLEELIQNAKKATDTRSTGPLLKMCVMRVKKNVEISFEEKNVTKLSEYLELTEYIHYLPISTEIID